MKIRELGRVGEQEIAIMVVPKKWGLRKIFWKQFPFLGSIIEQFSPNPWHKERDGFIILHGQKKV